MDVKETILLLMLLCSLWFPATSYPLSSNNLVPADLQANKRNGGIKEHNKLAHGSGGHAGGGGRAIGGAGGGGGAIGGAGGNGGSSGENGNGQSNQGTGTAVIPVYAAGAAAGQQRNHHSAAAHSRCSIPIIATILLAFCYQISI